MTTTPQAGLRQWQEAECHFLVSKLQLRMTQQSKLPFLFQWYKNNFIKNDLQRKLKSRTRL